MDTFSHNSGLYPAFTGENVVHSQPNNLWRPWTGTAHDALTHAPVNEGFSDAKLPKTQFTHPVKLFWPKSKCFDYLYQDAEMLLRNYPVQATICLYTDSSSDEEESEDDDEEEDGGELN